MTNESKLKRRGIRLTTVPNVNSAVIGRRAQHMGGGNADKNCAMCSAAGVLNLAQGNSLWSTGMVAKAFDTSDMQTGMGDNVDAQIQNIIDFCRPMTGRSVQTVGSMGHEINFQSAKAFMNRFADGTVFAINISGAPDGGSTRICHWLNAVKQGGGIEYVDFQADHKFRQQQAVSGNLPVLGITGQTVSDPEMVVIAFHK